MQTAMPIPATRPWWSGEKPVRLSCVPRELPVRESGRAVSGRTVRHWCLVGIQGVKLQRFRNGGQWCTTREALDRFFAKLTLAGE